MTSIVPQIFSDLQEMVSCGVTSVELFDGQAPVAQSATYIFEADLNSSKDNPTKNLTVISNCIAI